MELIFYNYEWISCYFRLISIADEYTIKRRVLMSKHAIVHVDIPAKSPAASSQFYADLFGWKLMVDPTMDYHMFQSEPGPGGGLPGGGFITPGTYDAKIGEMLLYVST